MSAPRQVLVYGADRERGAGWRVVLRLAVPEPELTPAEARALARELCDYADTIEFGWDNGPLDCGEAQP